MAVNSLMEQEPDWVGCGDPLIAIDAVTGIRDHTITIGELAWWSAFCELVARDVYEAEREHEEWIDVGGEGG